MKKILIATGSACSAAAIDFGVEPASEHEASVILVHVRPGHRRQLCDPVDEVVADATRRTST